MLLNFDISRNRAVRLPHPDRGKSRISVLVGDDEADRSRILRGLVGDVLNEHALFERADIDVNAEFAWRPDKVIAISPSAHAGFPVTGSLLDPGFYTTHRYMNIGARTGTNVLSRSQALNALALAALDAREIDDDIVAFMETLSARTGVPWYFPVRCRLGPYQRLVEAVYDLREGGTAFSRVSVDARARILDDLGNDRLRDIIMLCEALRRSTERVQFDLLSWPMLDAPEGPLAFFDPSTIASAIRYGFIRLHMPPSRSGRHPRAELDRAGPWNYFVSLATLRLSIQDDTLVLIDEPETSLHPRLQRTYVDDLLEAMGRTTGCHAVVATNSPLVAGSLPRQDSDVVRCTLPLPFYEVEADPPGIAAGWTSNDVLEIAFNLPSTRSPSFVKLVDEALLLIARGVNDNRAKLVELAEELSLWSRNLPHHDVARQIIASIASVAGRDDYESL